MSKSNTDAPRPSISSAGDQPTTNGDGEYQPGGNGEVLSEDAKDVLEYLDFLWPNTDDANVAARAAELNCTPWNVPGFGLMVRDRDVVVASRDDEEGTRAAQEVASECQKRGARSVRIWRVPRLNSKYPTMRSWGAENSLAKELEFEHACKWRGFVGFIGTPPQVCPEFSGPPQPITVNLLPVPQLDDELIPEPLRDWTLDIARRSCTPKEFPVAAAFVSLSGLIGCRLTIRPKRRDRWLVCPNLWGVAVGFPGILKSPMVEEAMRPLKRLIADASDTHKELMEEWGARRLVLAAKQAAAKKKLEKEASSKVGPNEERMAALAREAAAGDSEEPPWEERKIVNDLTIEKLQVIMSQNRNGLIYFRDELSSMLRAMDKQGHETDRPFLLECWEGLGSHRVERMGRPDVLIERACLSMFGTIQPGPLARYLDESISGEGADGLMPRFQVMVYPDLPGKYVYVDRYPDTDAKNKAYKIFKAIDGLDPVALGCEIDEDRGVPFLGFDDDAQPFFEGWYTELENRLRSGVESSMMTAQLSKYRSLMPALALLFHLIHQVVQKCLKRLDPVSLDAAEAAAAWCQLLESHARRIYQSAMDGDPDDAIRLSERIKASLTNPFTYGDVARKGWTGLGTVEEVKKAVGILEDRNWVKVVEVPTTSRGGRPGEKVWINPKVQDDNKEVDA